MEIEKIIVNIKTKFSNNNNNINISKNSFLNENNFNNNNNNDMLINNFSNNIMYFRQIFKIFLLNLHVNINFTSKQQRINTEFQLLNIYGKKERN